VRTLVSLAGVERERFRLDAARARLAEARALADVRLPEAAPELARIEIEAAWQALAQGPPEAAAAAFARAGTRARSAFGASHSAVAWAATGRGEALRRAGARAEARAALEDALARHRGDASEKDVADALGVLVAGTSLAALEREQGDLDAARAALDAGVTAASVQLGTDHPRLADALAELARVELARGDREAARRAAARAVEIARPLPPAHPTRAGAEDALARAGR
jgi:tetratricopeptide (TPR) repeat protein